MDNNAIEYAMDQGEDAMGPEYWEERAREEQVQNALAAAESMPALPEKMTSLYQIDREYMAIMSYLMDTEGEVDDSIMERLEVAEAAFDTKVQNYVGMIRMFEGLAETCKAQVDNAKKHQSRMQRAVDKLKGNLKSAMILRNLERVELGTAKVSFRRSEAVSILEVSDIPKEYKTVKVEEVPDKTQIKAAIKKGEKVPGAELVTNMNLMIQ